MRSTSPNFDHWRELDSIKVWEIGALMQGFDPRAIADVSTQDPYHPASPNGIPPDLSWEIKRLISAVGAGLLISNPTGVVVPDSETGILKTSLVSWLRANGRLDLADELDTSAQPSVTMPPTVVNTPTPVLPDPERRLKALRALGGNAKWTRYGSKQQWCFTKIKELTAQEKISKLKRSDEKTIRKDLAEAADAERIKKAAGASP